MNKKLIFLDRDGVINIERGEYTWKEEDVVWVPHLFEALILLRDSGYSFIVISNQGGISKGLYKKDDVLKIDHSFRNELKRQQIELLDSFYCPHHSELESCLCRKPKSLLLEKAIAKHDVDAGSSYFIGDSERDVIAGDQVGVKGIKVKANSSILDIINTIIDE